MILTEDQRRWWFANHPEFSASRRRTRGSRQRQEKGQTGKVRPEDVDAYLDEALKYETGPVAELLKSVKRNFGTQAYPNEHDESGGNHAVDLRSPQPKEPGATIGPPKPPGLSDRARSVLDIVCPGLTKAYDRWRTAYYEAYPWAPGPVYDALGDLAGFAALGLARIQAALAKAVNPAEIAALQNARQELLKIWDWPYFPRGWAFEDYVGRNLPRTFRGIDNFENRVATSNKTMDLRMKSYQDPAKVLSQGRNYVNKLANFEGATMGDIRIRAEDIAERVLRLIVPPGAAETQKSALKGVIKYGKQKGVKVEVTRVP